MKKLSQLTAISPVDGRYKDKADKLREIFSEYGLIKRRLHIEIEWLIALSKTKSITEIPPFSFSALATLGEMYVHFTLEDAQQVKFFEAETNHDVKAVEYFLKEKMEIYEELNKVKEFVHFGCTSEDINNLAYGLMLDDSITNVIVPELDKLETQLYHLASTHHNTSMLARTHGQPASPTTLGKEMRVYKERLNVQNINISSVEILGKINGAVGNYNAHVVAYPNVDWYTLSESFVHSLGLKWNPYTTQIEPHDYISELFDHIVRANTILIDLCRDMWGYISLGYFKQKCINTETGSSTMPHKINPIDFENAEGNLGMANAILSHLSRTLPISRWQRDLTDSTVLRNVGVGMAHSVIGYLSLQNGLDKVLVDVYAMEDELDDNWEVLGEAIQTVMRVYGVEKPYEKLKDFIRGYSVDQSTLQEFILKLDIPEEAKQRLIKLHPANYVGLASRLAKGI